MAEERLQKIIAAAGVASRRKAEELILAGKVVVNDELITTIGTKADPETDRIIVEGKEITTPKRLVVYALNKPKGVVSSRSKQADEKIVTELVPPYPPVYPVGRLDRDSEGLILLTNDGSFANKLTHPSYGHAKEYVVEAYTGEEQVEAARAQELLEKGVKLSDGKAKPEKVKVTRKGPDFFLTIVVTEGRHHLIRRMCAVVGLKVRRLKRVRIGTIRLDHLKPGAYRQLTDKEIRTLT